MDWDNIRKHYSEEIEESDKRYIVEYKFHDPFVVILWFNGFINLVYVGILDNEISREMSFYYFSTGRMLKVRNKYFIQIDIAYSFWKNYDENDSIDNKYFSPNEIEGALRFLHEELIPKYLGEYQNKLLHYSLKKL